MNGAPLSYCEVCELEHGLGNQNKLEPLKMFKDDFEIPDDLAGIYYNQMFERDTVKIIYEDGKLFIYESELIPLSETKFIADRFFAPINFIRNQEGKVTDFEYQVLERSTYKKIE